MTTRPRGSNTITLTMADAKALRKLSRAPAGSVFDIGEWKTLPVRTPGYIRKALAQAEVGCEYTFLPAPGARSDLYDLAEAMRLAGLYATAPTPVQPARRAA